MEHVNQNKIINNQKIKEQINPTYLVINKFINLMMIDGKKMKASKLFNEAIQILQERLHLEKDIKEHQLKSDDILKVVFQAIFNVTPSLEVRKVRRAGTTFIVPAMVSDIRGRNQGMRWIIEAARERQKSNNKNYTFSHCLAEELYLASKKQGKAREKRKELHNIALANRAFSRYRWW